MKNFVVGTLTKTKDDADPRDYRMEDLVSIDYTVKTLPKSFSWRKNIGKTYYQNGRGSCTSLGGTHCMQIQNIEEIVKTNEKNKDMVYKKILLGENVINLDWTDLRTKMGHILGDKNDSGDYVENMLKTLKNKGIKGLDIDGKEFIYFADGFSYANTPKLMKEIDGLKLNITKSPLVFVIKGNSKTWQEMQDGRIKTIILPKDQTGAHCIASDGYTNNDGEFVNSRRANDIGKKICSFKIDWKIFLEMVKSGMINWRYWNIFDRKDTIIDIERYRKKQEAMQTVRQLKKMYEKGSDKDKLYIEQSKLGDYLRKEYIFTDKDL